MTQGHANEGTMAAVNRGSWAWLNALANDLPIAAAVAEPSGLLLATMTRSGLQASDRLARVAQASAFQSLVRDVLAAGHARRVSLDRLDLLLTPVRVDRTDALLVIAVELGFSEITHHLLDGVTSAIRAQLSHGADEDLETFDRVSSLHRRLHDAVDRGSEVDVVTAFAEAVFAWDGVEVSGYLQDLEDQWLLSVSAPGARRGHDRVASMPNGSGNAMAPLTEEEAERFGFERTRNLLGALVGPTPAEAWFLVFAEGFGPLRESSARLYVDLLREALGRTSAIAETRAAWAILQPLLGATDVEAAAMTALTELARSLPADGASISATAPTGAVVLSAGDDENHGPVRAFGRVSRLVSTSTLAEGYTIDLAVRRAPGASFTRRDEQRLDRLAGVFGAWLSRALKQGTLQKERRAERRDFDQVLDRAASQALRDGTDVSIMVISAPDATSRPALLRSWVVELRSRLRGSDLAGALSDREIGLLLCGTTPENVDLVCSRLCRHLKFGDRGNPVGVIGVASRAAGQGGDGSLVQLARRNLGRRAAADGGASR